MGAPMTVAGHEEIALAQAVVVTWRADILAMVKQFGATSAAVAKADNIHALLERLVETVSALDRLAKDTDEIKDKAREYMARLMEEVGAFSVKADGVQAVLADAVRYPRVTNKDAVPAEYWVTPPAKIDMTKLGVDMRKGAKVEGAELSNGGAYTLRLTSSANKPQEAAAA